MKIKMVSSNWQLITILPFLLLCQYVKGQEEVQNNSPRLNGHYFTPVRSIPSPFINSQFGMNLGVAFSNEFENVILEIGDEKIIGLQGTLLFADLDFEYQQKIKDWIAFYVKTGLTARLGTELQSMLTQGVSAVTTFKMGWLFKIAEGEKYMLSGNAQINNYNGTFISIGDFIEDVIIDSVASNISKKVPSLNGTVGLRYAYGLNDLFGFQLFGEIGYGEGFGRGSSSVFHNIGGMIDFNLANRTEVPLGFVLSYSSSSLPDVVYVDKKSASNAGVKVSYTGAPHFNLGLEISSTSIPISNVDEKVRSTGVFITSKYFFN